ncbi:PaaI family thioesterase [Paenibacillus motobuensis]|uniref:Thioesterase domain-containing protein n=1 Tax=Paenibacillus motobuensis TaxID=295324 RepID=A0ABN0YEK1_9BACL
MEAEDRHKDAHMQELARLAKGTFWDYLGSQVETVNERQVVVTLEIQPHHHNMIGIVHGGVHATLLDSAMGLLAMVNRPNCNVVTTNLNMNYVAKSSTGKMIVTAELIHSSRTMITAHAFARMDNGDLCAFGTGTFRVSQ